SYFWDNSVAQNLLLSVVCWWLFGVFVISLMTLFSTISASNTGVLLGTGIIILISYIVGLLPKANKYLPTRLMDGNSLIYGMAQSKEYIAAMIVTAIASVICFAVSIPIFNKKHL
ncbi:MAG: ABC transporter permease, partial [Clostridia bacterium]|nr:ABC transporter permease [Clostridia bacterium]